MKNISLIIIFLGLCLVISYFIYDNSIKITNEIKANEYLGKPINEIKERSNDTIIGVLSIPKINLKLGFYDFDSKNNNVDKNITLLNNELPDQKNSTLIIAAHSGNSFVGFFKDLDKLNYNDFIEIHYKNKKYLYIVDNYYEEDKDGTISYSNNNEQTLILTTCSRSNKNKQLVIISKLYKIV